MKLMIATPETSVVLQTVNDEIFALPARHDTGFAPQFDGIRSEQKRHRHSAAH
jgi:hypothetical protein